VSAKVIDTGFSPDGNVADRLFDARIRRALAEDELDEVVGCGCHNYHYDDYDRSIEVYVSDSVDEAALTAALAACGFEMAWIHYHAEHYVTAKCSCQPIVLK